MGMIKYIGTLMLVALFAFAIITFADKFSIENNAYTHISDDQATYNNYQQINASVQGFKTESNGSVVGFYKADFSDGADSSTAAANLKLGNGSFIGMGREVINNTYYSVFGGDKETSIFLTTLLSFLGVSLVYYIWAAAKGGNVE